MSRQAAQQMIQQRALEATMAVASQAEQQLNQVRCLYNLYSFCCTLI